MLGCFALSSATARAQSAPTQLSFDQVVQTAVAKSPRILAARLEVERAMALLMQARAASMPTLTVNGTYTRLDADRVLGTGDAQRLVAGANQISANAQIALPVLAPARWAQWLHARDSQQVAALSQEDAARSVAMTAARTCLAVVGQHRLTEVSARALDTAQRHTEYAAQRLAGGLGNRLELLRAQSEQDLAVVQLSQARLALGRSREALGLLLLLDAPADCTDVPTFSQAASLVDSLSSSDRVEVSLRADLRVLQAQLVAASRLVRHRFVDFFPQLTASFAPFLQDPASIVQPQIGWQARLDLTWQLFDGGLRYGQHAERRVQLRLLQNNQLQAQHAARSEVRLALSAIAESDVAAVAAEQAASRATETLSLSALAYRAGATPQLALLDAERRAKDAQAIAVQATEARAAARLDLLFAVGAFPVGRTDGSRSPD